MASSKKPPTQQPKAAQLSNANPNDAQNEQVLKSESLTTIAWKQFRKHPMARIALSILAILYLISAFADFLAPYPESTINAKAVFQPPNTIRIFDQGKLVRPYVCKMDYKLDLEIFRNVWSEDCSTTYPIKFLVKREGIRGGDKYTPFPVNLIPVALRQQWGIRDWASLHLFGLTDDEGKPLKSQNIYLWGSDDLGRDIYGQVLFGGRISLTIGILGSLASILLGMLMGGLAGYFGGWIDELIMRLVEALSAIPGIFLLLSLSAIFYPLNWPSTYVFAAIIVALAFIGWGGMARSVRGLVLSIREQDFASAAKALGASDWRIITKHMLPQTLSYVIVRASLLIPGYIITEAVLSFYGLGIQAPSTSWGLMLSSAQAFAGVNGLSERWWIFLPGLFIFISVLTWNLLGDGLRDAFDPRSRQ